MKSPNSIHKHAIFVQDSPESLIANEHLNRSIHDAVGKMPLESPVLGVAVNFRTDTKYTAEVRANPAHGSHYNQKP